MQSIDKHLNVDKHNLAATKTLDRLGINNPDEHQINVVEKFLKKLAKTEQKVYLVIMEHILNEVGHE